MRLARRFITVHPTSQRCLFDITISALSRQKGKINNMDVSIALMGSSRANAIMATLQKAA